MSAATASVRVPVRAEWPVLVAAVAIGVLGAVSLKLALLAVIVICGAGLILARPSLFVPLLIASVFFGAVAVGNLTLARLVAPIAFAAALVNALRSGDLGLRGSTIHRWVAAYCVWALASALWTWDFPSTTGLLLSLLLSVTYMLAIVGITKTRGDLYAALFAFPVAASAIGALAIGAFIAYGGAIAAQGVVGDRNFFAALQVVTIAPTVALATLTGRRWLKHTLYTVAVVVPLTVVASGSQGGLIALLAVAAAAIFVLPRPEVRRRYLPLLATLVPLVAVATLLVVSAGEQRPAGASIGSYPTAIVTSSVDRFNLWRGAWTAVEERPAFGIGYGAFAPNASRLMFESPGVDLSRYRLPTFPQETHNTYLGTLAELGPLGLLLYLGMTIATGWTLWRTAGRALERGDSLIARVSQALLLSLVGFGVASLFLSAETNRGLWVIMALTIVCARLDVERPEPVTARPG